MGVAPITQSGPTLDVSAIVGIISAIAAAFSAGVAFWPLWVQRRTQRILEAEFGSELYTPEVLDRSTRYYIRPKCSSVDPGTESEMRNVVTAEQDLFEVMDKFLSKESSDRHLIILADSGMGKSSCLLNYYARNQRSSRRKRHRVAIVPLGNAKADEYIVSVREKQKTCIFLDAFDEDTKAIFDHRARLATLMDLCETFKRVVITCRTQFFAKDEEIPLETGILRFEPRRAGEAGTHRFKKIYLSPFDDEMVNRFLCRRYPLWRYGERRQARKVVRSIPLLCVRPMLLAFLPDLMASGAAIHTSYELYDALVDSWLERENRWVSAFVLREFSALLAVDLYNERGTRGAESIPFNELQPLAKTQAIDLESWQLTGRSLLNRDAVGNYKFSHRSIMEFFYVQAFLRCNVEAQALPWTDLMKEFLSGLLSEDPPSSALDLVSPSIIASTLGLSGTNGTRIGPHTQSETNRLANQPSVSSLARPWVWALGSLGPALVSRKTETIFVNIYNMGLEAVLRSQVVSSTDPETDSLTTPPGELRVLGGCICLARLSPSEREEFDAFEWASRQLLLIASADSRKEAMRQLSAKLEGLAAFYDVRRRREVARGLKFFDGIFVIRDLRELTFRRFREVIVALQANEITIALDRNWSQPEDFLSPPAE